MSLDLLQTPPAFAAAASCHQVYSRLCRKSPPGQLQDLWPCWFQPSLQHTKAQTSACSFSDQICRNQCCFKCDLTCHIIFSLIKKCRCHKSHQNYNASGAKTVFFGFCFFSALHPQREFFFLFPYMLLIGSYRPLFPSPFTLFSLHRGSIKIPLSLRSLVLMVGLVLMMTAVITGQFWRMEHTDTHIGTPTCAFCTYEHMQLHQGQEKKMDDKFFYIWSMSVFFLILSWGIKLYFGKYHIWNFAVLYYRLTHQSQNIRVIFHLLFRRTSWWWAVTW